MKTYRARLRGAGLRPVQLWLPDTRSPEFAAECRRQARIVAQQTEHERAILDWVGRVADTRGWEA